MSRIKEAAKPIGAATLVLSLASAIGYQPALSIAEDLVTKKVNARMDGMEQAMKEQEEKADKRYQQQQSDLADVKAETMATSGKMDVMIILLKSMQGGDR